MYIDMTTTKRQVGNTLHKPENLRSLIQKAESTTETASLEVFSTTITPELAEILLSESFRFENNRALSKTTVKKYAKKIEQGQWGKSAPIMFSDKGHLIDGQHRLNAVVKSGIAVPFSIMLGIPEETAENMDRGRRRTITDVSQVAGLTWVVDKHAATARWMCADSFEFYPGKKRFEAPALETETLLPILEQYREGIEFAVRTAGNAKDLSLSTILSVIAKAYYVCPDKRERLEAFGYCLKNGIATDAGNKDNAALKLAIKVRDLKKARTKSRGVNWSPGLHSECLMLTHRAVDLFLQKISVRNFQPADQDLFPLPEIFNLLPSNP